jgi:hypothetical protein
MLIADEFGGAVVLLLWIYCLLEVITTEESRIRNLPKLSWLLIVLLLPLVGSIAWLAVGRPLGPARSLPYKGNTGIPPEYDRPGRSAANNPDDDAAFLAQLKKRADEQRQKAKRDKEEPDQA